MLKFLLVLWCCCCLLAAYIARMVVFDGLTGFQHGFGFVVGPDWIVYQLFYVEFMLFSSLVVFLRPGSWFRQDGSISRLQDGYWFL